MNNKKYTKDWFDRCIPEWTELFKDIAGKPNLRFLEIGSYEGRSTCWLMDNVLTHPSSTITCLDLWEGCSDRGEWSKELYDRYDMSQVYENFLHNTKEYGRVWHKRGPSSYSLKDMDDRGPYFDFIYIDGSHIACDVLEDGVLAFPLLKEGGLLIFDDYKWDFFGNSLRHPKVAVDAFLSVYQSKIEVISLDRQAVIRKIRDGEGEA
jgi:predicted O-methyltransferase YrrM